MRISLTPRTTEFFTLFGKAGENALEVARLVERRFREHPNSGVTQEQVKAVETAGDALTRDLINLLNTQYITPFDREDIYQLATEIDDVVDYLEEASDLLGVVAVVIVALFFDFTNGFHDTANSIATSVSTRALSPRTAVLLAAILNFIGAFASLKVAATIATGIVNPEAITLSVILAGLVGAITWNLVTWFLGLPSSSSHALIGGIAGSAIAASGLDVIYWNGIWDKVISLACSHPRLASQSRWCSCS